MVAEAPGAKGPRSSGRPGSGGRGSLGPKGGGRGTPQLAIPGGVDGGRPRSMSSRGRARPPHHRCYEAIHGAVAQVRTRPRRWLASHGRGRSPKRLNLALSSHTWLRTTRASKRRLAAYLQKLAESGRPMTVLDRLTCTGKAREKSGLAGESRRNDADAPIHGYSDSGEIGTRARRQIDRSGRNV